MSEAFSASPPPDLPPPCLTVENLLPSDLADPVALAVRPGEQLVLVTPKEEASARLVRLLLGLAAEGEARVTLFSRSWQELSEDQRAGWRRRVGVVAADGGLISNLNVLENVLLPLLFHDPAQRSGAEPRARQALAEIGFRGVVGHLPDRLDLFQKKQVALARALLMNPEIMLYEGLPTGLATRERQALSDWAVAFHGRDPGRCSLFLTSDPSLAGLLPQARAIHVPLGLDT